MPIWRYDRPVGHGNGTMNKLSNGLTVGFTSAAHTLSHLVVLLYATVVLALEREWGLSYSELFALSIPMSVMFGAGALPAGWLADRWSAPGMIAVFYFGVGGAAILTSFAATPLGIFVGLTLIGTFAAIYHPVGIPWLIKNAANRGRALGINGVFGSVGTAGAAVVAVFLAEYVSWRAAFFVPGAITIAVGAAFILIWRMGLLHEAREDARTNDAAPTHEMRRVFTILACTVLCTGLIYQITSFALPKIFAERLTGASVAGIGFMVTFVYALSAVAQVIGGELADRYPMKTVYVAVQVLQVPVIAAGMVLYHPALIGVAAVMVSLNVAGQPAENTLLARYTPSKWRARAFGAKFVLTLGVSAGGVALIPLVHRLTGTLDALFIALGAFAAAAAAIAMLLPGASVRSARPSAAAAE